MIRRFFDQVKEHDRRFAIEVFCTLLNSGLQPSMEAIDVNTCLRISVAHGSEAEIDRVIADVREHGRWRDLMVPVSELGGGRRL
jgi:hypothetical protein